MTFREAWGSDAGQRVVVFGYDQVQICKSIWARQQKLKDDIEKHDLLAIIVKGMIYLCFNTLHHLLVCCQSIFQTFVLIVEI